jgi:hypothetical protein
MINTLFQFKQSNYDLNIAFNLSVFILHNIINLYFHF